MVNICSKRLEIRFNGSNKKKNKETELKLMLIEKRMTKEWDVEEGLDGLIYQEWTKKN